MSENEQGIFDFNADELFPLNFFTVSNETSNDASTTTSPGAYPQDPSNSNSPLDPFLDGEPFQANTFDEYLSMHELTNLPVNHINPILSSTNELIDESLSMNFIGGTEQADFIQQNSSWTQQTSPLSILIQPKARFRMRFKSEIDPDNHRPNRFVQGDSPSEKSSYPTIEIPSWIDQSRSWYIRVTFLTVTNDLVQDHYIHPYPIFASEPDVIEVREENSLYFPITRTDIASRKKSFQLLLIQPVQRDLQSHGPMRLFSASEVDAQQFADPQNVKKFINTYQLWKGHIAFTLTKLVNSEPMIWEYIQPSILSNPIADEKKNFIEKSPRLSNQTNPNQVMCIPSESEWHGNTSVVLIFPYMIKKKSLKIYVNFGPNCCIEIVETRVIDTKTMIIQTPVCPLQCISVEKVPVLLNVEQDNVLLPPIPFCYVPPLQNFCSRCQTPMTYQSNKNKRSRYDLQPETDGGEILLKSFNKLGINDEKTNPPVKEEPKVPRTKEHNTTRLSTSETLTTTSIVSTKYKESNAKFEAYLNKLKEAVSQFIRTEDPSLLFRRTRSLLLQTDDASPPLHDAIQSGHMNLVEKLFEQTFDMPKGEGLLDQKNSQGQTPLLISAQYNHWILIELILRQREDLAKQIDNKKNNFLHLLAEHQHVETIRLSLAILSKNLQEKLLNEKNQFDQRPVDIARVHELTEVVDLLTCTLDNDHQ